MAGLFPTNRARVAVQAFLASKGPETRDADRSGTLNGDSPSEEEEELLDVTISRPARYDECLRVFPYVFLFQLFATPSESHA